MIVGTNSDSKDALKRRGIDPDLENVLRYPEPKTDHIPSEWFYRPGDLENIIPRETESEPAQKPVAASTPLPKSLDEALNDAEESFSEMLIRKIDEVGISDVDCYKRAHVDRKLFSKIRSDSSYRPSKITAISFAIALELPLDEAKEMLHKAGYSFSKSNKFDIIIAFFINRQNYSLFEINEALFSFNQPLLY